MQLSFQNGKELRRGLRGAEGDEGGEGGREETREGEGKQRSASKARRVQGGCKVGARWVYTVSIHGAYKVGARWPQGGCKVGARCGSARLGESCPAMARILALTLAIGRQ